jgi:excisionase family DNA binding protein
MSKNGKQADTATASPVLAEIPTPAPGDSDVFIDTDELARRLNCSTGTIANWRKSGKIPWVQTPGRSVRFHWPAVRETFLRQQRGGCQ